MAARFLSVSALDTRGICGTQWFIGAGFTGDRGVSRKSGVLYMLIVRYSK